MLPDNVLLEIFDLCQWNHIRGGIFHTDVVWEWHILVHVCQRWRHITFASPLRLNLRIFCTHGTPVRKSLGIWPTFPIIIGYEGWDRYEHHHGLRPTDEDNIIAALEHPSRVCEVWLNVTGAQLGRIATVMQEPFPALTHLMLWSEDRNVPVLPSQFLGRSAPRLQGLSLRGIPFPTFPILLLSTSDLTTLTLYDIPQTGYISPEAMVSGLATSTRLRYLYIGFRSPKSRPDQIRTPPTTQTVLPALTSFEFRGVCEYLEDFAARINAPLLDLIKINYLNQLVDFEVPQLSRVIDHSEALKLPMYCSLTFDDCRTTFQFNPPESDPDFPPHVSINIECEGTDWQLSHLINVLSQISAVPSNVTALFIESGPTPEMSGPEDSDIDDIEWLQLLSLFSSAQELGVAWCYSGYVSRTLEGLSGTMATEVLPALHTLSLTGQSVSSIENFIAGRRDSDHPVTTFNGKAESGQYQ